VGKYIYNIKQLGLDQLEQSSTIDSKEKELIGTFRIKNSFNVAASKVEFGIYGLDGTLLNFDNNYKNYSLLQKNQSAGQPGASILDIDPVKDIIKEGYETGDVKTLYTFSRNLFDLESSFFVENISPDRTEIRLLSLNTNEQDLLEYANSIKSKLEEKNYFSEFKVNFGSNLFSLGVNIATEEVDKGRAIVIKLYEPLPNRVVFNSTCTIEEIVSDDILFEVSAKFVEDEIKVPNLKGPNFGIELAYENNQPTEYFNYNELFSYPVTNSYFELYSQFEEKSANITVNYDNFSNFIHFSSAEERLLNFKYKLELIESYEDIVSESKSSGDADVSGSYSTFATSSVVKYENLIKGIISNFDHYDRYLYFESSSNAWPKTTSGSKPHTLYRSSHVSSSNWFSSQQVDASNFDNSNFDVLTNTVPTYLREDSNNEPYMLFIDMIGQHFDNIWIYFNAVSDKYDADNRLDFGVSKDIVRSAVESFGVKLYNSNLNSDNLFSAIIGEDINTGSLDINNIIVATSASFNSGSTELERLQPLAKDSYEKEIYKRIYHNLPYLAKTKGTERGLRALINCFGIPESILSIKTFGGVEIEGNNLYYGPEYFTTQSSLDKIRLDNTGSITSGSTLSLYTSINKEEKKYTDDHHQVEIGFDISRGANEFLDVKLNYRGGFDLDDYIGDPRDIYSSDYHELRNLRRDILNSNWTWEDITDNWEDGDFLWETVLEYARHPKAFINLLNYFDSRLFRIIKDFLPARTKADTGAIIKSNKLGRSKAKQVRVTPENIIQSSSISIGSITGSSGGSYDQTSSYNYTTNYNSHFTSPLGPVVKNVTDESPQFTGEFSGSLIISTDGEVGKNNPFLDSAQPILLFDITAFNFSLALPPACFVTLTGEYLGEAFFVGVVDTDGQVESVAITYPDTVTGITGSYTYAHDFNDHEYFTIEASGTAEDEGYGAVFGGWYTNTAGTGSAISTQNPLTIYRSSEIDLGDKFYAYFTTSSL
jgi:hypothetical protein